VLGGRGGVNKVNPFDIGEFWPPSQVLVPFLSYERLLRRLLAIRCE
jgi:hypothetical protein